MLQYIEIVQFEQREWEHRFNRRAARGDFARNLEEKRSNLVDVLRKGPSDLARKAKFSVAAVSSWIQRLRGAATAPAGGTAD